MLKKILIATGGTGGHIYPAMALAQQFEREQTAQEILFIGGGLSHNRYFDRNAFNFCEVSCGTFTKKSPISLLGSSLKILKGLWQSRAMIRKFKPDVIIGFGSYYSFPPLMAAKWLSIPIVIHEANSIPGKVNRLLAPYTLATGVHFPQTIHYLNGNCYEVGMPLRNEFKKGNVDRLEARKYFGLPEEGTTLLVFGGSQGAQTINNQIVRAVELMQRDKLQVIHIAGDEAQAELVRNAYKKLGLKACVKPFENRMNLAWEAADLVVSRSGASTIAEQLEFEVPGILIPFARAADDHQNYNADFLVKTVFGAIKIQENELTPQKLGNAIVSFLDEDKKLLNQMKIAMREYKKVARKQDLHSLILSLLAR